MTHKINIMDRIPASSCCLISVILNRGATLSHIASEVGVSERTLRRVLTGHQCSSKTQSALINFYLHTCAHLEC